MTPAGRSVLDSLADLARSGDAPARASLSAVLGKTEQWSEEEMRAHQLPRFARLLEHARRTVPFYGGLDAGAAADMDRFRKLPLLSRVDLRDHAAELVSKKPPAAHRIVREANSSGSTGRHVTVKVDAVSAAVIDALAMRDHAWHGRDLEAKAAVIRAVPSGADAPAGRHETRWSIHPKSGPLAVLDVHTPVKDQLDWLAREDPSYLSTYAMNAAALVASAEEHGVKPPSLREVGTFGEVVPDGLREACRRTWGVPLADAYSAVEVGFIALECPEAGRYHVQSEHLLVEVLRKDGLPCGPGETGRVVLTTLHAFAMPLIRYEIGDHALVADPCPCGRGLPALERILGRARNMLRLPSGDVLWPRYGSTWIGKVFPLRQFRMVQKTLDKLVLEIVPTRPFEGDEETRLREHVLGIVRYPFELELRTVDRIPRLPGGKFEDFVCEIDA